ncbi:Allophanate hydrolase subunit 1 (modular protein) [Nostocoides japonicum T1-X7]|uniref:Allophanate hydrolase subunit 1 (Modular protein) n=1 Tax=Nostocoides japonicum T1-X7 TaxID=1194083 RepID=A0A077LYM1_9MICO|nr:carboxyltransferase domain-containing protein [Tetrasphaera japonica]CCH78721.1 Allophanate hydrolase subunit 1 (modular protein) [Tetrasphaera japonica T1-X7]
MEARLLPCGERAVLVELADLGSVLALRAAVAARVGPEETPEAEAAGSVTPPVRSDGRGEPARSVWSHVVDVPAAGPTPMREGGDGRGEPARSVWSHVVDVVPAARTVLVTVDVPTALPPLRAALASLAATITPDAPAPGALAPDRGLCTTRDVLDEPAGREAGGLAPDRGLCTTTVEIPVVYDGPDLAEVGRLTGLGPDGVVAAHTGTPWTVAFGGFAPGFAYLVGGDPRLVVPRRPRPRPRIGAGSVGLAGEYSGVYPTASPGGWQLIGRTDSVVWDVDRSPPALLPPGATVRFVEVRR